jgi:hypothetical protein
MPAPVLFKECTRRWIIPAVSVIDRRVLPPSWAVTCILTPIYEGAADGFLLLRNGALIRNIPTGRWEVVISLTGLQPSTPVPTMIEEDGTAHQIWPDTGDLPGPGETYSFEVIAYVGDPLADAPAGYRSPHSNVVEIGSEIWAQGRWVQIRFEEFDTGCLHGDETGPETWGYGAREVDEEGHPIMTRGCGGADLDEWATSYGGVNVNGMRVFSFDHYIHSSRRYPFSSNFFFYEPTYETYLGPSEFLTIRMNLYDGDLASGDEPYCHGVRGYSPAELE